MSSRMHYGEHEYRSITDIEGGVVLSKNTAIPETLDLFASVPTSSAFDHFACYERLMHVRRLAGMFSDGRSETVIDRRGMRHDRNIGALEQRWSSTP